MPGRHATAALLWAACRPEPDLAGVSAAVGGGADLEVAANAAIAQRVSLLLWRAIRDTGVPTDDASWVGPLHADAQRCRAQALLLLPRVGTAALTPLVEAGFEPLVLKGAALADRYPEPGLRPMTDVDLLLPAGDHRGAISVLTGAGWGVARIPGGGHYETALVHPELPGLPLELHRGLATWRERSGGPTARDLWRRRRPTVVGGTPAFGLGPEDELLALAAHAGKPFHGFSRLIWITDLVVVANAAGRVAARSTGTASRSRLAAVVVSRSWRSRSTRRRGSGSTHQTSCGHHRAQRLAASASSRRSSPSSGRSPSSTTRRATGSASRWRIGRSGVSPCAPAHSPPTGCAPCPGGSGSRSLGGERADGQVEPRLADRHA